MPEFAWEDQGKTRNSVTIVWRPVQEYRLSQLGAFVVKKKKRHIALAFVTRGWGRQRQQLVLGFEQNKPTVMNK
jgi:hypothetical protein